EFFGCLAVKYKFHKYLKHLSPDVFSAITHFEQKFIGNENDLMYGKFLVVTSNATEHNEEVEIPKILGDIFESVAAALYLDSGFFLDAVWKVYYKFFEPLLIRFSENIPKLPSRQLYESDASQETKTKFENATVNEVGIVSVIVHTDTELRRKALGRTNVSLDKMHLGRL
ncbi:endoribonuclease Dicer-like protein, partial [Leptotrombidium deliense]